jgi:hypothetical protein
MHYLDTFENWLKYQQLDKQPLPAEAEIILRRQYEETRSAFLALDINAVVHRPSPAGEYLYAVAIEDGTSLWLTLWVKRSSKGEYFVLYPRGRGGWNPHASYHRDGTYHQKSHNQKIIVQHRQPLDGFKGAEHLGSFSGHGIGTATCNPAAFTSVLRTPKGVVESTRGSVLVDLVEPGSAPQAHHRNVPGLQIVNEQTYRDGSPWVVVAVATQMQP